MPLVIFIWLLGEFFAFVFLVQRFSFLPVFGFYLGFSILSWIWLKSTLKRNLLGAVDQSRVVHQVLRTVGLVMMLPPTLFLRAFGFILWAPITRHLLVLIGQVWLIAKIMKWSHRFNSGRGGVVFSAPFFSDLERRFGPQSEEVQVESGLTEEERFRRAREVGSQT